MLTFSNQNIAINSFYIIFGEKLLDILLNFLSTCTAIFKRIRTAFRANIRKIFCVIAIMTFQHLILCMPNHWNSAIWAFYNMPTCLTLSICRKTTSIYQQNNLFSLIKSFPNLYLHRFWNNTSIRSTPIFLHIDYHNRRDFCIVITFFKFK